MILQLIGQEGLGRLIVAEAIAWRHSQRSGTGRDLSETGRDRTDRTGWGNRPVEVEARDV